MYMIHSTGVNPAYGKVKEKMLVGNYHAEGLIKKGWAYKVRYAGSGTLVIKKEKGCSYVRNQQSS